MTEREKKRLENIQQKIAQMRAQENTIISIEKKRRRKEKTRRIIQIGTLTEKLLKCEDISLPQVEKILQQIFDVAGITEYVEDLKKSLP